MLVMLMPITVEESVYAHLIADDALTGLVGDRIFPNQVPDYEPQTPWVYYLVTDVDPTDFEDVDEATTEAVSLFEFAILGDTYSDTRDVAEAIKSRLNGFAGGQVQRCLWDGSSAQPGEEGFLYNVRFRVWGSDSPIIPTQLGLPRVEVRPDGIYLDGAIAAGQGEQGEQGPPGPVTPGHTIEAIAGENLSALRGVFISPYTGRAFYASNSNPDHAARLAGVTVTAASEGQTVQIRTSGPVDSASWTWPGDAGIYLGSNGVLVQGYTASGSYSVRVGTVTTPTAFHVRIDPPILFS